MANDEFREQHETNRAAGVARRNETRHERAIRRQVAEEIAAAFVARAALPSTRGTAIGELLLVCAATARDIGSREAAPTAPARTATVHLTGPGAQFVSGTAMTSSADPEPLGEHSSNPREDG